MSAVSEGASALMGKLRTLMFACFSGSTFSFSSCLFIVLMASMWKLRPGKASTSVSLTKRWLLGPSAETP
jgi:hypothetical protein